MHGDEHGPSHAHLPEGEGVRIAWISVPIAHLRGMEMPHERVMQACSGDLLSLKRRMGHLAGLLPRESPLLRPVEECNVDATAVDGEAVEESIGVRRCAVCRTPKGESIGQLHRSQPVLGENVDVWGPGFLPIDALRPVPVVVARRDEHGDVDGPEEGAQERRRVRSEQLLLVQVPCHQECIDLPLIRDGHRAFQ